MRRQRRRSGSGDTIDATIVTEEGGSEHTSPVWLLITVGIFGFAWYIFSTIQITGTIQAAFVLLQTTITVTPGETAAELLKIQQNSIDSTTLIASTIGWAIQITLLRTMLPSEHYILFHLGRARGYITKILIGADVITDSLYVLHGRTVFDGFLHFAPGGFGILIVAVAYPIALISITVFCGIEMAHRVDRLVQCLRRIKF